VLARAAGAASQLVAIDGRRWQLEASKLAALQAGYVADARLETGGAGLLEQIAAAARTASKASNG
jgi:hypothetical protein